MGVRAGVLAGYGTRWVLGRAIPGTTQLLEGEVSSSEAGPVRPCKGLEWVGTELGRPAPRTTHSRHPVPSGARSAVLGTSSGKCRLLANKGEN